MGRVNTPEELVRWEHCKADCEAGMGYGEAARKHGINEATVRKRAQRQHWVTPMAVNYQARRLTEGNADENIMEIAKAAVVRTLMERGRDHEENVFTIASGAVKKAKMRPPKNWKDLEIADKLARRAAGLETAENVQQTLIQINEAADDSEVLPVMDADIISTSETVEEDPPPSELPPPQSPTPQ